jgi:hypothetical protein
LLVTAPTLLAGDEIADETTRELRHIDLGGDTSDDFESGVRTDPGRIVACVGCATQAEIREIPPTTRSSCHPTERAPESNGVRRSRDDRYGRIRRATVGSGDPLTPTRVRAPARVPALARRVRDACD